ncbi:MAG: ABC transporter permease [Solirubrobacteraceae bacterium]
MRPGRQRPGGGRLRVLEQQQLQFQCCGRLELRRSGRLQLQCSVGRGGVWRSGQLARTSILTVHSSIWIMVAVVLVLGLFLARTTTGRYMYATGGNQEAARIAGVRVDLVRIVSFTFSGGAAALAGIIDASRVLSAQSGDESALTFTVLAGIVIGGTSILGGEGAVWRTVVGVLFIALIGNGYDLLGLDPLYEQITLGVLMMLAVGVDAWARRRGA